MSWKICSTCGGSNTQSNDQYLPCGCDSGYEWVDDDEEFAPEVTPLDIDSLASTPPSVSTRLSDFYTRHELLIYWLTFASVAVIGIALLLLVF